VRSIDRANPAVAESLAVTKVLGHMLAVLLVKSQRCHRTGFFLALLAFAGIWIKNEERLIEPWDAYRDVLFCCCGVLRTDAMGGYILAVNGIGAQDPESGNWLDLFRRPIGTKARCL
jgi:hypothetical protein